MFGDYNKQFGVLPFPFAQADPQGGLFGGGAAGGAAGGFVGMEGGQPVPGLSPPGASLSGGAGDPSTRNSAPDPAALGSASPSVAALQTGNPLAIGGSTGSPVGANSLAAGAGAAPQPGAGAPAMAFVGGAGRAG